MDKQILEGLKGFEEVWKRVQGSKAPAQSKASDIRLMPGKNKQRGSTRFIPPK